MKLIVSKVGQKPEKFDLIERKLIGHPDTLADNLAEELSAAYSKYTLNKFGAILHHNFDKLALLGGASDVKFGSGKLTKPIRVLINGRASLSLGSDKIPMEMIINKTVKSFFKKRFHSLRLEKDLKIINNLSTQSSPGKINQDDNSYRHKWFKPDSIHQLPERKRLFSNDTSLGAGYAPYSKLDTLALGLDNYLLNESRNNLWMGTDIKIMAWSNNGRVSLTLCIPQIADYVKGVEQYKENIKYITAGIKNYVNESDLILDSLSLNTRDNFKAPDIYLTAIGSSIESGDEGVVGRGNRINRLITPTRPMSLEGASGKNPVYHVGKVYNVIASNIADRIHKKLNIACEVYVVSQSGRDLSNPWVVNVNLIDSIDISDSSAGVIVKKIVLEELHKSRLVTKSLIDGRVILS